MESEKKVFSINNLNIKFTLRGRVLHAIRDVSLDIYKGESLAIVGESGSGKSVLMKTLIGLLDKNGWLDSGTVIYEDGRDVAKFKTDKDWLGFRGKEVAMVMQDPMTSLNPLKTVSWQICEALRYNQNMRGAEARERAVELLRDVGIQEAERRSKQYPHEF